MASATIMAANGNTGRRVVECRVCKTRGQMARSAVSRRREMVRRFGDDPSDERLARRMAGGASRPSHYSVVHGPLGQYEILRRWRQQMTAPTCYQRRRNVIRWFADGRSPIMTGRRHAGSCRRDRGVARQRTGE